MISTQWAKTFNMNEEDALYFLLQRVSIPAYAKLLKKKREGLIGWDDPSYEKIIEKSLREHAGRPFTLKNLVDIINLSAMLYNFRVDKIDNKIKIAPKPTKPKWCRYTMHGQVLSCWTNGQDENYCKTPSNDIGVVCGFYNG